MTNEQASELIAAGTALPTSGLEEARRTIERNGGKVGAAIEGEPNLTAVVLPKGWTTKERGPGAYYIMDDKQRCRLSGSCNGPTDAGLSYTIVAPRFSVTDNASEVRRGDQPELASVFILDRLKKTEKKIVIESNHRTASKEDWLAARDNAWSAARAELSATFPDWEQGDAHWDDAARN